jgi:hypothetical protein
VKGAIAHADVFANQIKPTVWSTSVKSDAELRELIFIDRRGVAAKVEDSG